MNSSYDLEKHMQEMAEKVARGIRTRARLAAIVKLRPVPASYDERDQDDEADDDQDEEAGY